MFFGDYHPIHYPVGGASVVEMGEEGARSAIRPIQQELRMTVVPLGKPRPGDSNITNSSTLDGPPLSEASQLV